MYKYRSLTFSCLTIMTCSICRHTAAGGSIVHLIAKRTLLWIQSRRLLILQPVSSLPEPLDSGCFPFLQPVRSFLWPVALAAGTLLL